MKLQITASTDNKFLGKIIEDVFPVMLDETEFTPDGAPILIGSKIRRYYNSNYAIDVIEYTTPSL
jgi:hypothetical protein